MWQSELTLTNISTRLSEVSVTARTEQNADAAVCGALLKVHSALHASCQCLLTTTQ